MKYKVGDKVRVRQWDDMAKEFGESFGSIDIPHFYFPRSMEKYCGEVVTIEKRILAHITSKKMKNIGIGQMICLNHIK